MCTPAVAPPKHPHDCSFLICDAQTPPRTPLFSSSRLHQSLRLFSSRLFTLSSPLLSHQYASVATFFVAFRRSVAYITTSLRALVLTLLSALESLPVPHIAKFDIYDSVSLHFTAHSSDLFVTGGYAPPCSCTFHPNLSSSSSSRSPPPTTGSDLSAAAWHCGDKS